MNKALLSLTSGILLSTAALAGDAAPPNRAFASFGTPVFPASLYLAQLRDRLGDQAVKNIGY